jgi:ketosteroid isomerase-like protein
MRSSPRSSALRPLGDSRVPASCWWPWAVDDPGAPSEARQLGAGLSGDPGVRLSASTPCQVWAKRLIVVNLVRDADSTCLAPDAARNAAASWLRDTRVKMSRDTVDVAKRVVDAYNRRDVDGLFAELATPDFEWYPGIVRALDGGGYRGREGVARFAVDTEENWAELQIIPEEFRDLGDRVLVLGRIKGRGRGSGAPVDAPQAIILDFRGDRIWRSRVYLDRAEGLRAAGLSE